MLNKRYLAPAKHLNKKQRLTTHSLHMFGQQSANRQLTPQSFATIGMPRTHRLPKQVLYKQWRH
jgi:hypothetical protein